MTKGTFKSTFKSINWSNVLERALWTFLEGALLSIPVNIELAQLTDLTTLKSIIVAAGLGALGSAISSIKTITLEVVRTFKTAADAQHEEEQQWEKENHQD